MRWRSTPRADSYTRIAGSTAGKTAATQWLLSHVENAELKTALAAALDVRLCPERYRKSLGETFTQPMQWLRGEIAKGMAQR